MIKIREAIRANHGFTLVEMIVTFAILGILSVIVMIIIQTSAGTYNSISSDINLQYEAQTATSQIENYIIDCNGYAAVSSDNSALYIFDTVDDTHYNAFKIAKSATSNELYLYYNRNMEGTIKPDDPSLYDIQNSELLSSYVTGFTVMPNTKVTQVKTSDGDVNVNFVTDVTVTIQYGIGGRTYTGRQTIAFRNQVMSIDLTNISLP